MTFRGTVQNGKVVLDEGAELPEGMRVDVSPLAKRTKRAAGGKPSKAAAATSGLLGLLQFVIKDDDLPTDLAHQHDHYIYGTPKRPAWKAAKARKRTGRRRGGAA